MDTPAPVGIPDPVARRAADVVVGAGVPSTPLLSVLKLADWLSGLVEALAAAAG